VLDICLQIFYDLCFKSGVGKDAFDLALPAMLAGDAKDYYYQHVRQVNTFANKIRTLKRNYETESRRELKSTEWEAASLLVRKTKEPEKTFLELFDDMRRELMKKQRILRPELRTDLVLRDKLYSICLNVPQCQMALFKRAPTSQSAAEDLRNCLTIQSTPELSENLTQSTVASYPIPDRVANYIVDRKFGGQSRCS